MITISKTKLLVALLVAAAAGYGAHYLLPGAAPTGGDAVRTTVVSELPPPVPSGTMVLSSNKATTARPQVIPEVVAGKSVDSSTKVEESTPDSAESYVDDPSADAWNDNWEIGGEAGLDPDYEAYIARLGALEEAEDAAEATRAEPEAEPELTREELAALDEAEERREMEEYDDYLAELAEQMEDHLYGQSFNAGLENPDPSTQYLQD